MFLKTFNVGKPTEQQLDNQIIAKNTNPEESLSIPFVFNILAFIFGIGVYIYNAVQINNLKNDLLASQKSVVKLQETLILLDRDLNIAVRKIVAHEMGLVPAPIRPFSIWNYITFDNIVLGCLISIFIVSSCWVLHDTLLKNSQMRDIAKETQNSMVDLFNQNIDVIDKVNVVEQNISRIISNNSELIQADLLLNDQRIDKLAGAVSNLEKTIVIMQTTANNYSSGTSNLILENPDVISKITDTIGSIT